MTPTRSRSSTSGWPGPTPSHRRRARLAFDLWDVSRGRLRLDELVSRHGFHGPVEGELSSASWREDASPLKTAVAALEVATEQRAPEVAAAARTADRLAAEAQLLAQ